MNRFAGVISRATAAAAIFIAFPSLAWAGLGDFVFTTALVHIDPRTSSGPVTVSQIAGQPVTQPQTGTGVESLPANTVTFGFEWPLSDHVGMQLVIGYPPTHDLQGTGALAPAGVIGEGQQWSPALLLKYHFGESRTDDTSSLRPYVGAGIDYTFFRGTQLTNDAFRIATYGPNSQARVSVNSSWNPLATAGVDWHLNTRVSVGASVTYAPVKARIQTDIDNTSAGVPIQTTTDIRSRTVVVGIHLAYRFGAP